MSLIFPIAALLPPPSAPKTTRSFRSPSIRDSITLFENEYEHMPNTHCSERHYESIRQYFHRTPLGRHHSARPNIRHAQYRRASDQISGESDALRSDDGRN